MAGRDVLCSGCMEVLKESQARVLPFWNATVSNFVTTFRCGACWPAALADTRRRITEDDEALSQVCDFCQRNDIYLLEYMRRDPPEELRPIALAMLDKLDQGIIAIPIG